MGYFSIQFVSLSCSTKCNFSFRMDTPLISVVMSTYNGSGYLDEQIKSILAQTYSNFELIISDDASTDGTSDILKQYDSDARISVIYNQKNEGISKNFERAILRSKGAYISFADQDDIWMPAKIELLYQSISDYALVYSNSVFINENGNSIGKSASDIRNLQNIYNPKGLIFSNIVSGHAMLAKRELVISAMPFPEKYFYDWWITSLASCGGGVLYLNKTLTLYRQHTHTATKNIVENPLPSRARQKRYDDFIDHLNWIILLKNICTEKDKSFFNTLVKLYSLKKDQHFVWPLFLFLLRNKGEIFRYNKKSFLSKLIEIRKLSRGEKSGLS